MNAAADPQLATPGAKITRQQLERIVRGFVMVEPLAVIAQDAGVSDKTCRAHWRRVRDLMGRPVFNQWLETADKLFVQNFGDVTAIEETVLETYAACYQNTRCYSNFQKGLRKTRLCRGCPLLSIMGQDAADLTVHRLTDDLHDLYNHIGLRQERGQPTGQMMRLRYRHMSLLRSAWGATPRPDGFHPDFNADGELTVRHLYKTIMAELENA
ncbi:MAG: hypothetical protein ACFB2Z_04165 [Maricaulaceae bacterium]